MFGAYRHELNSVDTSKQVVATPWGDQFHVEEFPKLLPVNLLLNRHKFARRMEELGLSTEEDAVIRALVIVAPGKINSLTFVLI